MALIVCASEDNLSLGAEFKRFFFFSNLLLDSEPDLLFAVARNSLQNGALNAGLSVFLAICHLHLGVTGDSVSFLQGAKHALGLSWQVSCADCLKDYENTYSVSCQIKEIPVAGKTALLNITLCW